jgi:hypothetical protein
VRGNKRQASGVSAIRTMVIGSSLVLAALSRPRANQAGPLLSGSCFYFLEKTLELCLTILEGKLDFESHR